jgi:hypothetical protein
MPDAIVRLEVRPEVDRFAQLMEVELRNHDDRPGWKNDDVYDLLNHLEDEIRELREAVFESDGDGIVNVSLVESEAVDVGNMAMMVADVVRLRNGKIDG